MSAANVAPGGSRLLDPIELLARARATERKLERIREMCDRALAVKVEGSDTGDAAMAAFASVMLRDVLDQRPAEPSSCCAACDRFGDDGDPTARGCGLPDCPCHSPGDPS